MITIDIGGQKIEATITPIIITAKQIYSQDLFIFYLNGYKYLGKVSEGGRLVINLVKE
jgi:hypothetical protein